MLDALGVRVSLAQDNMVYIKQDGKALTANTDETLWFEKSKPTGKYRFEVKTKDNKIHVALLDWKKK